MIGVFMHHQDVPLPVLIGFILLFASVGLSSMALMSSRSKTILKLWADANGFELLDSEERHLRLGPFFFRTSRGQTVFYVTIRTRDGCIRKAWVRCGHWFGGVMFSDQATVEWAEAA